MGMTIEKMYGSYSDADLNDWERLPLNASVLTSSAFGAWLLRRDERRDKAIPKADYENRLKADLKAILVELQLEIEGHQESILGRYDNTVPERDKPMMKLARNEGRKECKNLIQQKINSLKED